MAHYFDHAATTPMRQVAIDTWVEHTQALNPGGQYTSGRKANAVLSEAREQIAELLGAEPIEVVFTASGTEADNIGVRGLYRASSLNRVVSTEIEHPAVLETVKSLAAIEGAHVDYLPATATGHVSDLAALDSPAAVATCMWANNETGAIQPVDRIVAKANEQGTPVHIDAVQVVGRVPINFGELGATTMAMSAHKFGGPRSAGILLAKRSPVPEAVILGGGQQRGIRSGTVDVASAAATAAALSEAVTEMDQEVVLLRELRDDLVARVRAKVDDVIVTTTEPALPGHAHFMFPGASGESMIMLLDSLGIEASTGSACHSGVNRMSHVLDAMGVDERTGMGALRLTLGRTTTSADVEFLIENIAEVVRKARIAGGL
ncbi:cysteine desulfurase family protein [Corynebacterium breve]|uniref:Cysteine desulfurase family protein n=1 Tax=Corynebacterium breve TaxID=3049799 RepID=A0ABY8VIR2_9CORY|nr:cysteine desulfurase family protein [Corynebacterium breve]WIM68650.1 cysteine desulfurase family protein [Corynebacterium breve]